MSELPPWDESMCRGELWRCYKDRVTVDRRTIQWMNASRSRLIRALTQLDRGFAWSFDERTAARTSWQTMGVQGTAFEEFPEDLLDEIWCWKLSSEWKANIEWERYEGRCYNRRIKTEKEWRWNPAACRTMARNVVPFKAYVFHANCEISSLGGYSRVKFVSFVYCDDDYMLRYLLRRVSACCNVFPKKNYQIRNGVPLSDNEGPLCLKCKDLITLADGVDGTWLRHFRVMALWIMSCHFDETAELGQFEHWGDESRFSGPSASLSKAATLSCVNLLNWWSYPRPPYLGK